MKSVEIIVRSGEVAELRNAANFTELGEYSVISVEQALEKLWRQKSRKLRSSQLTFSG